MKLAESTSALVLLAAAAAAAPSSAAEEQYAGRPPVECVAFESDEENPNFLQMGQCLTPGNAICSTRGSWALGIDPADRMIKLWEGNRVSSELFVLEFFRLPPRSSSLISKQGPAEAGDMCVHGKRYE